MLAYRYHYVIVYCLLFKHFNYTHMPHETENYINNNNKPITFISTCESFFYLYNIFTKATVEQNYKCLIIRIPLGIKVKIKSHHEKNKN